MTEVQTTSVREHWTGPCLCDGGRVMFGEDDEGRPVLVHSAPLVGIVCPRAAAVRTADDFEAFERDVKAQADVRRVRRKTFRARAGFGPPRKS